MTMSIIVKPQDSLVHEKVSIKLAGLTPNSLIKVELRIRHSSGTYRSYGCFKTDGSGFLDIETAEPIRGTYAGARGMGLFESVEPTDDVRFGAYCKCKPQKSFNYQLIVTNTSGEIICTTPITKRLMHPKVEMIEVEQLVSNDSSRKKVTGTLFKPPGDGPFPTIIDISGTGGGINEQKAAALASRGFCAFSLAFFQFKNLPDALDDVDVNYFEDAINFIVSLPFTTNRVGMQGVSFGGTLVMYLATKFPQLVAVVSINGSFAMDEFAYIKENGVNLKCGSFEQDGSKMYFLNNNMCYDKQVKGLEVPEEARFKLENTKPSASFRFVSSLDDLSTPTIFSTNYLSSELKKFKRKVEIHYLPGGHLMDPPCFPAHPVVYSKIAGLNQAYGGDFALHGKSQFDAWEATIQFFAKHLGKPTPLSDYTKTSKL